MSQAVSSVAVGHIVSVARSSATGDNSHMQRRGNDCLDCRLGNFVQFPEFFHGRVFLA